MRFALSQTYMHLFCFLFMSYLSASCPPPLKSSRVGGSWPGLCLHLYPSSPLLFFLSVPLVTSGLLRVGPRPHVSPQLPSSTASLPQQSLAAALCPAVMQSHAHVFLRVPTCSHTSPPCKSPYSLLLTYVTCPLLTCHWIRRLRLTGALLQ